MVFRKNRGALSPSPRGFSRPRQQDIEKRREPRYPYEFHVVIRCGNESFSTKTLDFSSHGFRVAGEIPAQFFNQDLELYVSSGQHKEPILLRGRFVERSNRIVSKKDLSMLLDKLLGEQS